MNHAIWCLVHIHPSWSLSLDICGPRSIVRFPFFGRLKLLISTILSALGQARTVLLLGVLPEKPRTNWARWTLI
ncbi:unnamed protein product [Linum trigynum]|uniref:Uncharacterized protein n=1 Tax=Linum trigynum TaxID=586398 RepID=A0AAV2D1E0_9ROSI